MPTILKRLFEILKSYRGDATGLFDRDQTIQDFYTDSQEDFFDAGGASADEIHPNKFSGYPDQIVEDLSNFNLQPPSSFSEVKKARNRESKKYHPDRFADHPEKQETAKEIMQIYNASYARLKIFFKNQST